ncbi:MAG: type IV pilus assembly protein PilM [Desulfatibacillaceae bacterium]
MRLKKKHETLIGLDIGSGSIKLSELENRKGVWVVRKYGMVDLPMGAIEEGIIRDANRVAERISELRENTGIREVNAAISIAGYSVIVKNISVQKMSDEEMQENLHVEAEQYLPFDVKDVYLDFHIVGENADRENQMNLVLVAAKKDMVDEYVSVVEMANLNPCIMDVDAFALQNIYDLCYEAADEEVVALVDVGATKTNVNILKNRSSVLIRDVSMGGLQITQEIMARTDCSFEEAERWKVNGQSDKLSAEEMEEIFTSACDRWCEEIRPAIDFFYSVNSETRIDKIFLSGGGGLVSGFQQMLSASTGITTEYLNPFQNMEIEDASLDTNNLDRISPQAAISLGLALRRVGDK